MRSCHFLTIYHSICRFLRYSSCSISNSEKFLTLPFGTYSRFSFNHIFPKWQIWKRVGILPFPLATYKTPRTGLQNKDKIKGSVKNTEQISLCILQVCYFESNRKQHFRPCPPLTWNAVPIIPYQTVALQPSFLLLVTQLWVLSRFVCETPIGAVGGRQYDILNSLNSLIKY